jgi:hypothetical protein
MQYEKINGLAGRLENFLSKNDIEYERTSSFGGTEYFTLYYNKDLKRFRKDSDLFELTSDQIDSFDNFTIRISDHQPNEYGNGCSNLYCDVSGKPSEFCDAQNITELKRILKNKDITLKS